MQTRGEFVKHDPPLEKFSIGAMFYPVIGSEAMER